MGDVVRVMVVEPGEEPREVVMRPDSSGSYLAALQGFVGGYVEAFDPLFGDEPLLWVNEDGISSGLAPNRAVYANRRMEEMGYVSQMDWSTAVRQGELYTILFGTIVAVSYDAGGVPRDLSGAEAEAVKSAFGGPRNVMSGLVEAQRITLRRHAR